jgi:hypothetical protein
MGILLEAALRYVESRTRAEIRASISRIRRSYRLCLDCRRDTRSEFYMLRKEVWLGTNLGVGDGMLCIGCVETRLGRRLTPEDFTDVPANSDDKRFPKSARLLSRLGRPRSCE